jgi:hypothetical protein
VSQAPAGADNLGRPDGFVSDAMAIVIALPLFDIPINSGHFLNCPIVSPSP